MPEYIINFQLPGRRIIHVLCDRKSVESLHIARKEKYEANGANEGTPGEAHTEKMRAAEVAPSGPGRGSC